MAIGPATHPAFHTRFNHDYSLCRCFHTCQGQQGLVGGQVRCLLQLWVWRLHPLRQAA